MTSRYPTVTLVIVVKRTGRIQALAQCIEQVERPVDVKDSCFLTHTQLHMIVPVLAGE